MGKTLIKERPETGVPSSVEARKSGAGGTRARIHSGRVAVTDGPFTETKEFLGSVRAVRHVHAPWPGQAE